MLVFLEIVTFLEGKKLVSFILRAQWWNTFLEQSSTWNSEWRGEWIPIIIVLILYLCFIKEISHICQKPTTTLCIP